MASPGLTFGEHCVNILASLQFVQPIVLTMLTQNLCNVDEKCGLADFASEHPEELQTDKGVDSCNNIVHHNPEAAMDGRLPLN